MSNERDNRAKKGQFKKFQKNRQQHPRERETGIRLKYGKDCNLLEFKQKLAVEAMKLYGDLARIIETGEYYEPPEIDINAYNLANDPHRLNRDTLREDNKQRAKEVREMISKRPQLYACIYEKLSRESIDALKTTEGYEEYHLAKDPLALWLAIVATHKVATTTNVESVVRLETRSRYQKIRQGTYESIVSYKERFDEVLEAYNDMENPEMADEDIAMDFFNGLDDARYGEFKTGLLNDMTKGTLGPPESLLDIYTMASRYLVRNSKSNNSGLGATFATRADDSSRGGRGRGRGGHGGRGGRGDHGGRGKRDAGKKPRAEEESKEDNTPATNKPPKRSREIICWGCGEPGHVLNNCPENDEEEGRGFATSARSFASGESGFEWYEVLLDNEADISVVHPRLLYDIRRAERPFRVAGLSGHALELPCVGKLDQFFECKSSVNAQANILCMADVEDMHEITYKQGESFTVHLPGRDLVFERRDKMYVADMRDWANARACVTTTKENEKRFTRSEVRRAKEARELVRNAAYPSERDALNIVEDGNILNVPVTAQDVRRAYEIYGKPAAAVRGRRTNRKTRRQQISLELKMPQLEQEMYTDVMQVKGKPFVITLVEPLGLEIVTPVDSEKTEDLGLALQGQVNLIRSRGFKPTVCYLDPQPGFVPLVGQIPGVEIDVCGAGDHLDKIDAKIRRIKESIRSVHADLPWELPNSMVSDLVTYCNSRINLRRASSDSTKVSPRVAFTGRKPNYKKELGLAFGDYVEVKDPKAISNDAA
jgi:hypothetical protein